MDMNKRTLRSGGLIILAAIVLRIVFSCTLGDRMDVFAQPELAEYLMGSDREILADSPEATVAPAETEPVEEDAPTEPVPGETVAQTLTEETTRPQNLEDSAYVQMQYSCSRQPDIEALLEKPLSMDLTGEKPSVLIIHTHGTEAFTPTEGTEYEQNGGEYRTKDDRWNMLSLGEELARLLQAAGINVIHDKTYYDYPDYEASYDTCREGFAEQLKKYPSIQLVVDLHRDAAEQSDGTQWATSAMVNGEESAQVMLVMGTDCYYEHPNWEENLSLALKLQVLMEKEHPGVTRPLDLRKQRFNQDLSTGAIIAEIGAAGNTHQQAMNGVSVLAEAIIRLADGTT